VMYEKSDSSNVIFKFFREGKGFAYQSGDSLVHRQLKRSI
jgi:hypothetical protein